MYNYFEITSLHFIVILLVVHIFSVGQLSVVCIGHTEDSLATELWVKCRNAGVWDCRCDKG